MSTCSAFAHLLRAAAFSYLYIICFIILNKRERSKINKGDIFIFISASFLDM